MRVPILTMRRVGLGLLLGALLASGLPARAGRVVLVGVDGGSWDVIDPMLAAGELPNLAVIAAEGVTAELETVEPLTSPVVWTSIATGRTPEHHGVTDFFKTALQIRTPTVFERLAARGARVGLYDYLMTWPPASLPRGFVLPGWLRRDDAVTPPDAWSRIELEPWLNAYSPLKTSEDYRRNALEEVRGKAARWNQLAEAFDVEVGAVSFYAPDSMSHRFWHGAYPERFAPEIVALATEAHRSALRDAMRGIDRSIGEIRSAMKQEDVILIASDHGFRAREDPSDVWVSHFGDACRAAGLDPDRDGFAIATEFGQLVIRVHPGEFERADETTRRLAELIESYEAEDGTGLYWAAEIFDGTPRPPGHERSIGQRLRQWILRTILDVGFDVLIDDSGHAIVFAVPRAGALQELWPDGPVSVGGVESRVDEAFSRQVFTGEHDETAIFLAAGAPIRHLEDRGRISVLDVAPLIFHLAGSPVPDDLEGGVPEAWLAEGTPVRHIRADLLPGIRRGEPGEAGSNDPELLEKLRRLGYID